MVASFQGDLEFFDLFRYYCGAFANVHVAVELYLPPCTEGVFSIDIKACVIGAVDESSFRSQSLLPAGILLTTVSLPLSLMLATLSCA